MEELGQQAHNSKSWRISEQSNNKPFLVLVSLHAKTSDFRSR